MKTILIIEDDSNVRQVEGIALNNAGYEILEASNAKEGITLAIEKTPDLILMDVRLPSKKRGIGAAKILRANETTRNIPIIFVTGYTEGEDSNEIKNISKHSYIAKPFKIQALLAEIKKYIR